MAVKEASAARPSARERLLAAANELFYNEGVHTVGIDRVIEQAGVAKASLYNTFGSKDELVRAYLETRHASVTQRITQAVERYDTPRERLLAVFEGQGELFAQPDYRGCAFARASAESHPGDLAEQAAEVYRRWVRDAADRAGRAGRRARARGPGPPAAPALRRQRAVRADGPRPRRGRRGPRRRGRPCSTRPWPAGRRPGSAGDRGGRGEGGIPAVTATNMSLVSRRVAAHHRSRTAHRAPTSASSTHRGNPHHRPPSAAGIAGHDSTADRGAGRASPDRQPGSVPEIQAVDTCAFNPTVMPVGKVHRQIDMSAQVLKTGVVEPSDRTYVAATGRIARYS